MKLKLINKGGSLSATFKAFIIFSLPFFVEREIKRERTIILLHRT